MTDTEAICAWMEPKPEVVPEYAEDMDICGSPCHSPLGFWICDGGYGVPYTWQPRPLTLDALRDVESRLSEDQWPAYKLAVRNSLENSLGQWSMRRRMKDLIHLSAERKITCLAAVLRKESK